MSSDNEPAAAARGIGKLSKSLDNLNEINSPLKPLAVESTESVVPSALSPRSRAHAYANVSPIARLKDITAPSSVIHDMPIISPRSGAFTFSETSLEQFVPQLGNKNYLGESQTYHGESQTFQLERSQSYQGDSQSYQSDSQGENQQVYQQESQSYRQVRSRLQHLLDDLAGTSVDEEAHKEVQEGEPGEVVLRQQISKPSPSYGVKPTVRSLKRRSQLSEKTDEDSDVERSEGEDTGGPSSSNKETDTDTPPARTKKSWV